MVPPIDQRGAVTPQEPDAYADVVALLAPFDREPPADAERGPSLERVARWLLREATGTSEPQLPASDRERRRLVTRLLTVRPPRPFPSDVLGHLDALFAAEARQRPTVTTGGVIDAAARVVKCSGAWVALWRGDITTLAVDAIVNAANADLLGCFRPEHACIDNAIHTAAGPRLREDCHRIMTMQGHREATGTARVTRAYYLPSRFVVHTVGPVVSGGAVTDAHRVALAACYHSCLDRVLNIGARSVALCAVSTGVFGYPKDDAAAVAASTVRQWLEQRPDALDLVVFDIFGDADERAYLGTDLFS
jgi:O-acetyl-ADP-ribose deacetylase (regulator of RNase III)